VRKKRGPKKGKGAVVEQLRAQASVAGSSHGSPSPGTRRASTQQSPLPLASPLSTSQALTIEQLVSPSIPVPSREWTLPADPVNDSYFSFDEFAHNILSSSSSNNSWPVHHVPTLHTWSQHHASVAGGSATTAPFDTSTHESPLSQITAASFLPAADEPFEANELIRRGVELFLSHLYPTYPIVSSESLQAILRDPTAATRTQTCLVWSMCAMTLMYVDRWPGLSTEQRVTASRKFIRKCSEARLDIDLAERATYYDVLCSWFIGLALFELKCRKSSWFYVREAITLSFPAGLQHLEHDTTLHHDERIRRARAFALLFITERGACVLDIFPCSIMQVPFLPHISLVDEDPSIASGLQGLHNLFSMLDFSFVKLWNDPNRFNSVDKGYPELCDLQDHLCQTMDMRGISDIQRADVLITQQWLRLVFWQAALRGGLISTNSNHPAFTYKYPIEIAASLCDIVKSLPPIAIQVHGLGIFEKQFEIAYSLLDALNLSGTEQPVEAHENLRYLLLSLSASPSSRQIYVRTLEKKMGNDSGPRKYRSLAGVRLMRDDSKSRSTSRRHSVAAPSRG
jgi:hypothetical protein